MECQDPKSVEFADVRCQNLFFHSFSFWTVTCCCFPGWEAGGSFFSVLPSLKRKQKQVLWYELFRLCRASLKYVLYIANQSPAQECLRVLIHWSSSILILADVCVSRSKAWYFQAPWVRFKRSPMTIELKISVANVVLIYLRSYCILNKKKTVD
jgi:hypothetical protein